MGFLDGLKAGLGLGNPIVTVPVQGPALTKSFQDALNGSSASLSLFDIAAGALQRGSKELLASYRTSPHVRKVVNLIANQLAATDYYLEQSASNRSKSKALGRFKALNQGEIITEHPFLDFLYGGNPLMPGTSSMKLNWVYYLLKGEMFMMIVPLPDGAGMGWMAIPPTWVQETPCEKRPYYKVAWGTGSKMVSVPAELMLWIKDPDVLNPYGRGVGQGDTLRDEIDTDEYASVLMRTTLANKGLMEGILQIEHADQASLAAMRLEFEKHHRGTQNSGKVMVIDGTTVNYVPLAQAFSELKLLELRQFEKSVIEETFCVPPELFGEVTSSNRATIYEARNIFATNVLIPNLDLFSLELGLRWLPYFDKTGRLSLEYVSPAPKDQEARRALIQLSPQSFTANEIREEAGLPHVSWGDVRYVPAAQIEVPAPGNRSRQRALARLKNKAAPSPSITQTQIDAILSLYTPRDLALALGPQWRNQLDQIVRNEYQSLGIEPNFDVVNPMINRHVEKFGLDRLAIPVGTSKEIVAQQIAQGVDNLESIESIAKRLVAVGATDQTWRSRMIARTEIVRSSNIGREISWKASGLLGLKKRWLSALGESTRDSHAALHRDVVGLDDVFVFDPALSPGVADQASSPGSASTAAHSVNCRCTVVAFDPEHDSKSWDFGQPDHVAAMKAFEQENSSWEQEAEKAISAWYANIEVQTLDILNVTPERLDNF